jgi:hypothetical protein
MLMRQKSITRRFVKLTLNSDLLGGSSAIYRHLDPHGAKNWNS